MKTRSELAADRDAELLTELRAAGYVIEAMDIHLHPAPVRFGPRVVALIERRWHNQGWDLRCPQFKRRGYRAGLHRAEPNNPQYWGSRPFKKPASIREALAEASNSLPTAAEIERAKQRAELDSLNDWVRQARDIYRRVPVELLDFLLAHAVVDTDTDPPALLIQLGAMRTAQADYKELARRAEALALAIAEKD